MPHGNGGDVPQVNSEELLWEWCRFGWYFRKINERSQEEQSWYTERIKHEMSMITRKGLADF